MRYNTKNLLILGTHINQTANPKPEFWKLCSILYHRKFEILKRRFVKGVTVRLKNVSN